MKACSKLLVSIAVALLPAATSAWGAPLCVGDCDGDRSTTVSELITGVSVALDHEPVQACANFDDDGDGRVTIDELTAGIHNALDGCPSYRFIPAACTTAAPPGMNADSLRCGFVLVPEDRDHASPQVDAIAIMVVPSTSPNPGDPIVFVDGGPGHETLNPRIPVANELSLAPFVGHHDVIFFDQRGVGLSQPAIDCPEVADAQLEHVTRNLSAAADADELVPALQSCRDRYSAAGINLNCYNSAAVARDIADIVAALGYDTYDLLGTSYGSRIALTVLRDVPEKVHGVVLELPVPVQANLLVDAGRNFERAIDLIAAACAAEPGCHTALPDLKQAVLDTAVHLDAMSLTVPVKDPAGHSMSYVLNGDRFLAMVLVFTETSENAMYLPRFLREVAGCGGAVTSFAAQLFTTPGLYSVGFQASIGCYEEVAFLTPAIVSTANCGVAPRIAQWATDTYLNANLQACAAWHGAAPPALEHEPVSSSVPVLVMTGQNDPVTPSGYGEALAATLPHAQVVELPSYAHSIFAEGDCGAWIEGMFFSDPMAPVDTACMQYLPPLTFMSP